MEFAAKAPCVSRALVFRTSLVTGEQVPSLLDVLFNHALLVAATISESFLVRVSVAFSLLVLLFAFFASFFTRFFSFFACFASFFASFSGSAPGEADPQPPLSLERLPLPFAPSAPASWRRPRRQPPRRARAFHASAAERRLPEAAARPSPRLPRPRPAPPVPVAVLRTCGSCLST